jgi:hypothetical protein
MAAKNGHAAADDRTKRLKDRQDLQATTLRGDIRDVVLRLVRELPDHWKKMAGGAQEDVIERIERLAATIVDQTVDIVTSRGADSQVVRLGKISADKGMIECKFTVPYSNEALIALGTRQGQEVVLIARDTEQFKGEREKAESDNIGDLAIPRGRTFQKAMAESAQE